MAWGEVHEIPYDSKVQERIIGPFSLGQVVWILPSAIVSYQFSQLIPKIPIDSIIFSRIHWLLPLGIGFLFAYFKNTKTNQSLFETILTYILIRKRRRVFVYKRYNQIYPERSSNRIIYQEIVDEDD